MWPRPPTSLQTMFLLCSDAKVSGLGKTAGSGCMSSKRKRDIRMPAPYLRRIWLEPSRIADRAAYPFCLPFLLDQFELSFDRAITIIVRENRTGNTPLLDALS